MAFRYVCGVFVVLAAVGIVWAACGPQCPPPPTTAPLPAAAVPQPAWTPPPCPGYPVAPPAPLPVPPPSWGLSVADGKLLLETADGARSACEKLTILVVGTHPVEVTVSGKKLVVGTGREVSGGDSLAGTAERVTRGGPGGAVLTLEGDATVVYVRKGKRAEITAGRVSVHLATGQVVGEMETQPLPRPGPVAPSAPGASAPITPSAPPPAVGPATKLRGAGQEFSFFVGLSR